MAGFDLPVQAPMSARAEAYAAECLERSARAGATVRNVPDVAYGSDACQKLDLYLPAAHVAPGWPTLVFMHGGYWTHGHKEWLGFMAEAAVTVPAAFVSVGYRLAPAARYPAQVEDCAAAVARALTEVRAHGGDQRRIVIGGHSAGGHLAAMLAFEPRWLEEADLAFAPAGLVSISGVYDLEDPGLPQDRVEALLGDSAREAASPLRLAAGTRIPALVAIGSDDFPVLRGQHARMVAALRGSGAPIDELEVAGADHFDMSLLAGDPASALFGRIRALLER